MSSSQTPVTLLFSPRHSRIVLGLEIALHLGVFAIIWQISSGWWLFGVTILFGLVGVRFFRQESIRVAFPPGLRIEFRHNPDRLIWYDPRQGAQLFDIADVRCYLTRWFVLVQLRQGWKKANKLFVVDSFETKSHYTRFRRKLIEMCAC